MSSSSTSGRKRAHISKGATANLSSPKKTEKTGTEKIAKNDSDGVADSEAPTGPSAKRARVDTIAGARDPTKPGSFRCKILQVSQPLHKVSM